MGRKMYIRGKEGKGQEKEDKTEAQGIKKTSLLSTEDIDMEDNLDTSHINRITRNTFC